MDLPAAARLRVFLSLLPVVAALILQWFYWSTLQPYGWFFFYPAVLLSAWIGGLRAGIAATAASLALVWSFFPEPQFSYSFEQRSSVLALLLLFAITGVLISLLHGRLRTALAKSEESLKKADEVNALLEQRLHQIMVELEQTIVTMQKGEERFHHLFDRLLEGCQIIGFDWRYLYVNESSVRHSNAPPAKQMLGRTVMEVFPALKRTDVFATLERCMTTRTPGRLETRYAGADGRDSWFVISAQPAPEGISVLSIDITELKRAETALRESDERFRQIAESLPQLIWTATPDGVCDFLNGQWEQYAGLAKDSQTPDLIERIHPEDRSRLLREWRTAVAGGVAKLRAECRLQGRDGTYRWFDSQATALRDVQGHVVKWFGSCMDIDERRRAQELQLHSQKMEALGTLAGGIAHDFNSILLAIRGNARLAKADLEDGHPALECLGEIDRAGTRATDLVRRILAFSRQEEPKREVIQLRPVIQEAATLLRSTLPSMIQLRCMIAEDVPPTTVDAGQLYQVIMNLVTNAAHAIGHRPGTIDIHLDTVRVDKALAGATPGLHAGHYVRMSVNDTGCGIDQRTLQRIFDPFFTTKPVGQGTGLGLSVVDGIMKSHNGAITVDSQPGKGTHFRLYFPATQNVAVSAPAIREPVVGPAPTPGQRVLYVDDDDALVFLAERTLSRRGYQVTGCTDPRAALKKFVAQPAAYDVVITDLSMPTMLGFELAREMFAVRPDLPVIITSGYIRAEDHETARQLGVVAVILKPNTIEELGETLDGVISGRVVRQTVES